MKRGEGWRVEGAGMSSDTASSVFHGAPSEVRGMKYDAQ